MRAAESQAQAVKKKDGRNRGPRPAKEVDKRSLDYLLRSGLAGGLAGCAVRRQFSSGFRAIVNGFCIGQNRCRTPR